MGGYVILSCLLVGGYIYLFKLVKIFWYMCRVDSVWVFFENFKIFKFIE